MITDPKLENRAEQPYMGIRALAPVSEFPTIIPQLTDEVYMWLEKNGIPPAGASFIRYHVINMPGMMDIALGVPVTARHTGDARVIADALPAGRYATLLYTGDYSGLMDANRVLVEWAKENGIEWDAWDEADGHVFRGRYEVYIKDPGNEPDPAKWVTEVAIKLADN